MTRPYWLDPEEYPFESRFFETGAGRMHYVDEGRGDALVFVHGVPSWSFLFRKQIRALRDRYRCVAMDHLGFGLSDKPFDYAYDPMDLSLFVERLLDSLGLDRVVLVVHDWGGPLGLPYAFSRASRVRGLVLFNTWMWPVAGDRRAEWLGRFFASTAFASLDRRYNATVRLLPQALGPRTRMSPLVYRHYAEPLARPEDRRGVVALARAITASAPWLAVQWQQSGLLADIPALLAWGMADLAFTARDLGRWQALFRDPQVHRYERVGHFPPEEAGEELADVIDAFAHEIGLRPREERTISLDVAAGDDGRRAERRAT